MQKEIAKATQTPRGHLRRRSGAGLSPSRGPLALDQVSRGLAPQQQWLLALPQQPDAAMLPQRQSKNYSRWRRLGQCGKAEISTALKGNEHLF